MAKVKEKFFPYFESVCVLLTNTHESRPEWLGKKIALCLKNSIFILYPSRKNILDEQGMRKVRNSWMREFFKGFVEPFKEHIDIVNQ